MGTPSVFVTGSTGYMGRALLPALLASGCEVTALVRPQSLGKHPQGCRIALGDPLDAETYLPSLLGKHTLVNLVGTPHPAPWKGKEFRAVDQVSFRAALAAAQQASVRHFVYVSVAHPAPIMRAYVAVRSQCEAELQCSGLPATVLRPWYVLGEGHRWPYLLLPAYRLCEVFPATREGAQRLGLVTLPQMVRALTRAVLDGPEGWRVLGVPEIRASASESYSATAARGLAPGRAGSGSMLLR